MNGFAFGLFASVFMIFLTGCTAENGELKTTIKKKLKAQPEQTLQDLYKDFFQDECGPGHLLSNPAGARNYFDQELEGMTSKRRRDSEPCGLGENFVRVPMDLVKDGLIDKDEFFSAFIESSKTYKIPDLRQWIKKWQQIEGVISEMNLGLKNFESDREALRKLLEKGQSVVHHSESYSQAYDPHYRIMGTEQWKQLQSKIRPK